MAEIDPESEFERLEQLSRDAQMNVMSVAQVIMNTYENMRVSVAGPMAMKLHREQRALFDDVLRRAEQERHARGIVQQTLW